MPDSTAPASPATPSDAQPFPDDLPPVKPPSAGFILQLFVVPAVIVAALFIPAVLLKNLVKTELDVNNLVEELQHPNEHRRWRAAHGLAQALKADQELGTENQHLSENKPVATKLAALLDEELKRDLGHDEAKADPSLKFQAFLARTLGLFDLPDVVLPVLETAIRMDHSQETGELRLNKLEVRKNALSSIMVIADRAHTRGSPLHSPELVAVLEEVSQDREPLVREVTAYTLAVLQDEQGANRLVQMLVDADYLVRVNAAVGLTRAGDTRGLETLLEVLSLAHGSYPDTLKKWNALSRGAEPQKATPEDGRDTTHELSLFLSLKNSILALERVSPKLSDKERAAALAALKPIAANFTETNIRHLAVTMLPRIEHPEEKPANLAPVNRE